MAAAHGDGRRLRRRLRHQVELRTDEEVAEVVAAPPLRDQRIAADDAADVGIGGEDRAEITIDAVSRP